jgi:hypothetical protein
MYVQLMSQIMTLMSQIMTLNVLKGGQKVGRFRFFYWDVFTGSTKATSIHLLSETQSHDL